MNDPHPNILFIVIDGMTKEKFATQQRTCKTPNIDSLLLEGTFFAQTISTGSVTIPAMGGIFSSLYPFECLELDETLVRFNSKIKNFPKYFSNYGFHTIATVPESFSHTGFTELFNEVHEYDYPSTLFDGLGENILKIISQSKNPWFYYVHLSDLHNDIDFESNDELKQFNHENYGDNKIEKMISAFDFWLGKILSDIDKTNTLIVLTADHGHEGLSLNQNMNNLNLNYSHNQIEPGKFVNLGHKVVEKFPEKLNPLRKKLSSAYKERKEKIEEEKKNPAIEQIEKSKLQPYEKRILKNTVQYISHVYDERFLIPLLLVGRNIPVNKRIKQQVRSIDIFPTICELLNIPLSNFGSIRGVSLMPLLSDVKTDELPILLDSVVNSTVSPTSDVLGIRTSHFKYFRDRNNPSQNVHLYDLNIDPREEKNIQSSHKDIVNKMENILKNINNSKDFTIKNSSKLTESEINDAKDVLKKLGYV